ncbi:MAG: imidazole glycerol phosphate synthase subunit HisF [Candidatus Omnitrophica bacterium]|nr:imidazole glycerol phosphate synthase subunit HisF [Candidatus Omnitrophota bacterium]
MVKIIPCLDVKNRRVVKGIRFVNLRDAADPVEAAVAYCKEGADELVFLDIAATIEERKTRLDWVKSVVEKVTIPFCVGGGIGDLKDIEALFKIGVNKVSINTAAVRNPSLIKEAVSNFGKERVVIAIDARKNPGEANLPRLEVLLNSGEVSTGLDVVDWAKKVEALGAAEILLTSKDADGTEDGFDIEMTKAVAEAVKIPVTASGGAGKLEHFYQVIIEAKATNVLAASVFHFGKISVKQLRQYLREKKVL